MCHTFKRPCTQAVIPGTHAFRQMLVDLLISDTGKAMHQELCQNTFIYEVASEPALVGCSAASCMQRGSAHMEPPVVSLLIALEENLQSSRLLRETLGCASGAGGPRRGGPTCPLRWRRPPVLEASEGARSNNHTCAHTAYSLPAREIAPITEAPHGDLPDQRFHD